MRKYYFLEPEVAGGIGENTKGNWGMHPPIITHLHYQFDGWLGDELLTSFPCFIVTNNLLKIIEKNKCSGVVFDVVEISTSEEFEDFHQDLKLPEFKRLIPIGTAGVDDFGIADDYRLVVSEKALNLIKPFCSNNLDIYDYS